MLRYERLSLDKLTRNVEELEFQSSKGVGMVRTYHNGRRKPFELTIRIFHEQDG